MVPLQVLAVSGTSTPLPGDVTMMHTDMTELVMASCESTGRHSDHQQTLTTHSEACDSAASDLQPTLDYKQSGYCDTYFNAVFQLQCGDTLHRSQMPADDYRSTVERD